MVAKHLPNDNDVNDLNLRDIFAAFAMCGMLSHYGASAREKNKVQIDADGSKRAYDIADAMMNERQKNER
jgi:predicted methyltransferase MtxX (methanogen marker protein 4)